MSSSIGENLRITIFGQSHSPAIGCTLEGIPAGKSIDEDKLAAFLQRRASRGQAWATPRKEADAPEFLGGLFEGKTCGAPIAAVIRNSNTRSKDYSQLKILPRPGHADLTAEIKYFGSQDYTGGGHFSGRLTAPLCIAGGICLQLLEAEGITVLSRIAAIEDIEDRGELLTSTAHKDFPTVSDEQGLKMQERILQRKAEGDSSGGLVECAILGLPAGLGDPMFGGMENRIASLIFGIPAVKGLEFGDGFGSARTCGSRNNDSYGVKSGSICTETNHCGGILGGITNGMPLTFRCAFKPTPSISRPQQSVNLQTGQPEELVIQGRHDPCIVPRAVPVVEAAAAIAVYDALLGRKKEL
ncbi:MAG: chorismate synthase [Oscillospiraceae bacterium]|nr:chorismate synthase [Oscillospiraceae bacterium]